MGATPKLDVVVEWLASDRTGPLVFPARPRWPDPLEWSDPAARLEATLAMASSGAMAELPVRFVRIRGKLIPAPPAREFHHGARHRPPKARSAQRETTS